MQPAYIGRDIVSRDRGYFLVVNVMVPFLIFFRALEKGDHNMGTNDNDPLPRFAAGDPRLCRFVVKTTKGGKRCAHVMVPFFQRAKEKVDHNMGAGNVDRPAAQPGFY